MAELEWDGDRYEGNTARRFAEFEARTPNCYQLTFNLREYYRIEPDILDYAQTTKRCLPNETQVPAALCCGSVTLFFGLIMKADNRIDADWCPISFFVVLIENFKEQLKVR